MLTYHLSFVSGVFQNERGKFENISTDNHQKGNAIQAVTNQHAVDSLVDGRHRGPIVKHGLPKHRVAAICNIWFVRNLDSLVVLSILLSEMPRAPFRSGYNVEDAYLKADPPINFMHFIM